MCLTSKDDRPHVDAQEWGQFLDMPNSAEKSVHRANDAVQRYFLYHRFARSLPQ